MAGFVDVSGMTDAQVKTLCQTNEPDQPLRRTAPGRYVRKIVMYDTSRVFAVAYAAYRNLGNEYVQAGAYTINAEGFSIPRQSNRELMVCMLASQFTPTDVDCEMGEKIRRHYQGLMFNILAGRVLNEFDARVLTLASSETVSERDLGTIAYLPKGYENATLRQTGEDRIANAGGGYVGQIGDKVLFKGEVIRRVFSQQWMCYFITMITDDDQAVFFSNKSGPEIGSNISARGTVKAHHADGKTQFNRVKILDKFDNKLIP